MGEVKCDAILHKTTGHKSYIQEIDIVPSIFIPESHEKLNTLSILYLSENDRRDHLQTSFFTDHKVFYKITLLTQ